MSFLGDLMGYDSSGHDLIGIHKSDQWNCPACGIGAMRHTPQMEAECSRKLFTSQPMPNKTEGDSHE